MLSASGARHCGCRTEHLHRSLGTGAWAWKAGQAGGRLGSDNVQRGEIEESRVSTRGGGGCGGGGGAARWGAVYSICLGTQTLVGP